jgi:hypothetical protein
MQPKARSSSSKLQEKGSALTLCYIDVDLHAETPMSHLQPGACAAQCIQRR